MILVTGASGFVGGALVRRLIANRTCNVVVTAVRREAESPPEGVRQVQVGELLPATDWGEALQDVDANLVVSTVENRVVVASVIDVFVKVRNRLRRILVVQFDVDVAVRCMKCDLTVLEILIREDSRVGPQREHGAGGREHDECVYLSVLSFQIAFCTWCRNTFWLIPPFIAYLT